MSRNEAVYLSVVAPAFNEEEIIESVLRAWKAVLDDLGRPWEIVITDDGSSDRTVEIIESLNRLIPSLRMLRFEKNQGYGPALAAAIRASRGEYVATIDSDAQFDLSDAGKLLEHLEDEGLDAVTGYRMGKKDAFIKVLADRVLNFLVNLICGVRFKDNNCALKVVKGDILRNLHLNTCWMTPSEILVRLDREGRSVGQMGVTHRPRPAGTSKIHVIVAQCIRLIGVIFHLRMELYFKKHRQLFDSEGHAGSSAPAKGEGDSE